MSCNPHYSPTPDLPALLTACFSWEPNAGLCSVGGCPPRERCRWLAWVLCWCPSFPLTMVPEAGQPAHSAASLGGQVLLFAATGSCVRLWWPLPASPGSFCEGSLCPRLAYHGRCHSKAIACYLLKITWKTAVKKTPDLSCFPAATASRPGCNLQGRSSVPLGSSRPGFPSGLSHIASFLSSASSPTKLPFVLSLKPYLTLTNYQNYT